MLLYHNHIYLIKRMYYWLLTLLPSCWMWILNAYIVYTGGLHIVWIRGPHYSVVLFCLVNQPKPHYSSHIYTEIIVIPIVWFWNFFGPIIHNMRGPPILVIFFEVFPLNMFFGAQSKETVTFTPTKRLQMCLWAISWGVCGYVYLYLVQCLDDQQKTRTLWAI